LHGIALKAPMNVERLEKLKKKIHDHDVAVRKHAEEVERRRAEVAEQRRAEKEFGEALDMLLETCTPDAIAAISVKARSINILSGDNDDLQEQIKACHKAKTVGDKTEAIKNYLWVVKGLADLLRTYWEEEKKGREDNLERTPDGDGEREQAVKAADVFLNGFNDSEQRKMSQTMRDCTAFLQRFLRAPFR